MNEALVEHAQHDIHGEERGGDEQRHVGQRRLEDLRRALKTPLHAGRHVQFLGGLLDDVRRLAERDAGREVEGKRHGRKLALVIDRKTGVRRLEVRDAAQRHLRTRSRI